MCGRRLHAVRRLRWRGEDERALPCSTRTQREMADERKRERCACCRTRRAARGREPGERGAERGRRGAERTAERGGSAPGARKRKRPPPRSAENARRDGRAEPGARGTRKRANAPKGARGKPVERRIGGVALWRQKGETKEKKKKKGKGCQRGETARMSRVAAGRRASGGGPDGSTKANEPACVCKVEKEGEKKEDERSPAKGAAASDRHTAGCLHG